MVETIFVPRGAEERAVRTALARSPIRVVATGIGPRAAARAADEALASGHFGTALVTGLCGTLSPSFVVGDALVYREIYAPERRPLLLEQTLADGLARSVPGAQTGIRAVHSDRIVTSGIEKHALGVRYGADAVDMESYALADRLAQAGVAVGVLRVASDAVGDDLPAIGRALDGSGGIDEFALALAFARAPFASARLIAHAMKALAALQRTVATLARAR